MTTTLKQFWTDESGATALEYALLAAIIAVAVVAAGAKLQPALVKGFDSVAKKIPG